VRATTLLAMILDVKKTKVVKVSIDDVGVIVADVAPTGRIPYCSGCLRPVRAVHDRRERRWRHLDLAGMRLDLRYVLRRVKCPGCGVTVELVPWAVTGSWFTQDFEDHAAYLAQKTDKTTIVDTLRVAWRTVGAIVERVVERYRPGDPLDGLTHIGVDELSFRKHHAYVTVVIDHVNERVVWVRPGKSADTLGEFFKDLGPERCHKIASVTMDMSPAYIAAVKAAVPEVQVIFDRFHVQRLAHDALDEVRRAEVRASESIEEGRALKRTRFILHKNPWNLTNLENQKLTEVRRVNAPIYRAYLMKETLAEILDGRQINVARTKLNEWISWAAHSHLKPFEKLARTVKDHIEGILAYVQTRHSNGRTEGMNGKIRTITRRSFGFHSASNLIALIYLCCSGISLLPVFKFAPTKRRPAPSS
jgi:transposase